MRSGVAADAVVVLATAAVVVVLVGVGSAGAAPPPGVAGQVLTLTAAAVAAGVAILGSMVARLAGDPRLRWIAAALALYAVVVLPSTAITVTPDAVLPLGSLRVVAYLVIVGLLLAAVRPPAGAGVLATWLVAAGGALLAVAALAAPAVAPAAVQALARSPIPAVVILGGWLTVACAVLVEALRSGSRSRGRLGMGLTVLAGAQLYRVLGGVPFTDLLFGSLRLLGLLIMIAGLAQQFAHVVADLRSERFVHQEELAVAAMHMENARDLAAERDHELRNGLAGLAGITHLLSSRVAGAEQERLRHAVLAELTRLHALLDPGSGTEMESGGDYPVAPVLDGLVALRRSAGADVDLDVERGLRARGDSAVLAQVVTNLLANCDRHAPGAPLTVRAISEGRHAVVLVRDTGPGLPPGREESVVRPGVRDARAGGSGLGLSISERLIVREGGTLEVATVANPRGCLATVRVPLARPPARDHAARDHAARDHTARDHAARDHAARDHAARECSGPVELPRSECPDDSRTSF